MCDLKKCFIIIKHIKYMLQRQTSLYVIQNNILVICTCITNNLFNKTLYLRSWWLNLLFCICYLVARKNLLTKNWTRNLKRNDTAEKHDHLWGIIINVSWHCTREIILNVHEKTFNSHSVGYLLLVIENFTCSRCYFCKKYQLVLF